MSLASPGELEMQLICQPYRAERLEDGQLLNVPSFASKAPTFQFHFTLCGEHQVGKSSLLWRYAENVFGGEVPRRAGHDFKEIHYMVEETPVKLFLWDWPTGEERFRPAPSLFFRQKTAVMLVVDLTNPTCLEDVEHWLSIMKPHSIQTKLLLGNKADMTSKRTIRHEDAEGFASSHGMYYFETSAKDGTGVAEAIEFAVFDAVEKMERSPGQLQRSLPQRIKSTSLDQTSKTSCYVQ